MRLTIHQIESIKKTFTSVFDAEDHIWLFGSRVDRKKRGGDIDLYIETVSTDFSIVAQKQLSFLSSLKKEIGDQKIDLIINMLSENKILPIYKEAKSTGILLV
jgi:predicted nucleotidyltransferase